MSEKKILKGKILSILYNNIDVSISLQEFIDMTEILELEDMGLKVRAEMIKTKKEEYKQRELDDEWNFFNLIEEDF